MVDDAVAPGKASRPDASPLILHAASEVVGFAKTGGLADVVGSLPCVLARHGYPCVVMTPLYRSTRAARVPMQATPHRVRVPLAGREIAGAIWQSTLADGEVPVYLVEQPEFFERDDPVSGAGLYQFTRLDGTRVDYPDNAERYAFFCQAVVQAIERLGLRPAIVHAHDWQTGLLPVYLQKPGHPGADGAGIHTVFTIHNIAYQGVFPAEVLPRIGLDWRLFNPEQLEFYGQLNCLKAGIVFAERITTVSARYALEIQTPYFGCGLQGVLSARRDRLTGIVNGVDYRIWNPAHDPLIASRYDSSNVSEGKAICKAALQRRFRLPEQPRAPLLGMVSRLVEQKGLDLLREAAPPLLAEDGVQLVVLGDGEPAYRRMLQELQARYPQQVGLALTFDEGLAHQIEAGADIYLMPSLYEPSGLNQLYSLKYGTVPVVRATGGLADTIVDVTPETLASGTATGFCFTAYAGSALLEATRRALALYRGDRERWLQVVRTGMSQDWSWDRSAREYQKLYDQLLAPAD